MSKRKRRAKAATMTPPADNGPPALIPPVRGVDPWAGWRWMAFAALSLGLLAGWGAYTLYSAERWPFDHASQGEGFVVGGDPWEPPVWRAAGGDDEQVDRFVDLQRKKAPAAADLLAPLPAGDGPVSEAEFEAIAAGHFLREKGVWIRDVWRGEPGDDGKPRPREGRYTFVTRGNARTPSVKVRDAAGNVSPTSYGLHDPVVVVEVKGGKIHPLRAEINRAP